MRAMRTLPATTLRAAHRAEASTLTVSQSTAVLPDPLIAAADIEALSKALERPARPLLA